MGPGIDLIRGLFDDKRRILALNGRLNVFATRIDPFTHNKHDVPPDF